MPRLLVVLVLLTVPGAWVGGSGQSQPGLPSPGIRSFERQQAVREMAEKKRVITIQQTILTQLNMSRVPTFNHTEPLGGTDGQEIRLWAEEGRC